MFGHSGELQIISVEQGGKMPAEERTGMRAGVPRRSSHSSIRSRRRRKKRRRILRSTVVVFAAILLVVCYQTNWFMQMPAFGRRTQVKQLQRKIQASAEEDEYPLELAELLEQNEETYDFVKNYTQKEAYIGKSIDLSNDYESGSVPLLMQWDKRWGYDLYGDAMIGLAGCGPTCMAMAYLYYTGDLSMNPRVMAEYAQEEGYHTPEGTSWEFWTTGAQNLGLSGQEVSLSENSMKAVLDSGGLLVCSMSPGDFTTGGHYILLHGYDNDGFFVNDPNRKSNSDKQWTFDKLSVQIKNLWGIYGS